MKKRIAIVTAALMALAAFAAPAAFADETEAVAGSTSDNPIVFDYHDIDETVYEGQWWDTGLGFDMYLPADWVDADLTEEMVEAGVVHIYGEDGGGANCTIVCTELPAEAADTYDIDQLGTELAASNTAAMFADLSGIPSVVFANDETCISGFAMLTGDGYMIQGVISAPSDDQYEEYGPVFENITMSISPTVAEAETEAAQTE
jgi:opacity protein-like surface antigen